MNKKEKTKQSNYLAQVIIFYSALKPSEEKLLEKKSRCLWVIIYSLDNIVFNLSLFVFLS